MTAEATTTTGNDCFLSNMRALWRVDPVLAYRVDAVDDENRFTLEPTRSGHFTARARTDGGGFVHLHSRFEPLMEAQRLVDAVDIGESHCFIVQGMGLGYHLRALHERLDDQALIICCEPSLELVSTALSCNDLSDILATGRLVIMVDDDKARLHKRLSSHSALMMLGMKYLRHAASVKLAPRLHERLAQLLSEFATYTRMSIMTLVSNSQITCKNVAMNLCNYVTTPPIDMLSNRFAGCPAVVIAAGPSLHRNIDKLAALKGKAVLIAVQTALKPLLQRGVVPDFVTSLDYHEMSRKYFEGVEQLEHVHLVAEPKATWHVIDDYPGPVSLVHSEWATLILGEELGRRGGLKAGATVAHLAFYLAAYMGCDPIIFVGQDLAYTGHVFYAPGVEIHRAWRSELNRFSTMEMKEWERIVRNRPILRTVQGQSGQTLYTDELLFTYLEQFEKDIAATNARVINAGSGGASIGGTTPMTLETAAAEYCRTPIDAGRFDYREQRTWRDLTRVAQAATEVRTRLEELGEVESLCVEMLTLLEELKGLTDEPNRFNRRLVRVDELRTKVTQMSRPYHIVNYAAQLSELRRFSADRQLGKHFDDEVERALRQIARDVEFVTGVRDGGRLVTEMLESSLERIEAMEGRA